jgi:hypothetical protein
MIEAEHVAALRAQERAMDGREISPGLLSESPDMILLMNRGGMRHMRR